MTVEINASIVMSLQGNRWDMGNNFFTTFKSACNTCIAPFIMYKYDLKFSVKINDNKDVFMTACREINFKRIFQLIY